MSLSKQHLSPNAEPVRIDMGGLAQDIRDHCPTVAMAFVLGSAGNGIVEPGSDLDIAVFSSAARPWQSIRELQAVLETRAPGVRHDIGVLNGQEPVYRFEALRGRLLFTRDCELFLDFFSRTCREYADQCIDYDRQLRYRRQVA